MASILPFQFESDSDPDMFVNKRIMQTEPNASMDLTERLRVVCVFVFLQSIFSFCVIRGRSDTVISQYPEEIKLEK